MNSSVDTLAITITLNATARTAPGSTVTQTSTPRAARKSSTRIPAASTTIRRPFCRNAVAAEASTYGMGKNTRIMIPISWTSPPQRFTA